MTSPPKRYFYEWYRFVQACKKVPPEVFVWRDALRDAREQLKIFKTEADIRRYIADGAISDRELANSTKFTKWPKKSTPPMVDSYRFSINRIVAYIAIYVDPEGFKWNIKSLKMSDTPFKSKV